MTLSSEIIKFVELNGPSTVFDIAKALNLTPKRVSGVISKLVKEGKLKQTELVVEGRRRYRVYLPKKWDKTFVQWHGKILAVEGHRGRPLPLTQRIIELLQNSDKALFSTEIADLLDADRRSVSRALSELWKRGRVKTFNSLLGIRYFALLDTTQFQDFQLPSWDTYRGSGLSSTQ